MMLRGPTLTRSFDEFNLRLTERRGSRTLLGMFGNSATGVALGVGFAVLLTACALSKEPALMRPDATIDGIIVPSGDSDRDGICDSTEQNIGTNPFVADSDSDGFPDDVELAFDSDPHAPGEPNRDDVVYVSESATAALSVMPLIRVRGMGQTFTGYIVPGTSSRASGSAAELVQAAFASGAYPMSNVFRIDTEAQRFEGVEGTTQLLFELRLFAGSMEARDCRRSFVLRYFAKTSEGAVYSGPSYLVVVTPDAASESLATWCAPQSCY